MKTHTTSKRRIGKNSGFPLFRHQTGRWAKKVRGTHRYFGKIEGDEDGQKALALWLLQKDDLLAGRQPRPDGGKTTVGDAVNAFLNSKLARRDKGQLSGHTFDQYHKLSAKVIRFFGANRVVDDLQPADFTRLGVFLAAGIGVNTLTTRIVMTRSIFGFAFKNRLIDRPLVFGSEFSKPERRVLRRLKAGQAKKILSAAEIRMLIDKAGPALRAMILLAINTGMGQSDLSAMPIGVIADGWLAYPRVKTGAERHARLWSKTTAAITEYLKVRPEPADPADKDTLFLTTHGRRWVRFTPGAEHGKGVWTDTVNDAFRKLLESASLWRKGLGFYALRHTFRTVADSLADRPAVDLVMGHGEDAGDMRTHYVQFIEESRLQAVADHVRKWLFPVSPVV